ncbi:hypothetical protein SAMN05192533_101214 [Mesobacillus persicus]|uniref:Uncharacterized protein n=1 Tax=Mesobacillus persicus TaxID=930146 RepID=A0A1H7W176_9BACI|nr:hypothetical protein [Mesobacillus persicus]SEM15064.1 hypothetical protein SAMN05192533_101214 [Mesobacillus persicus]
MKKYLPLMVLIFSSALGLSFLLVVLRVIWFPPASMGMMMGKHRMFHHLSYLFSQTFLFTFLIGIIVAIIWLLFKKTNN